MNLNARIGRLEARAGKGLRVIVPYELDSSGQVIDRHCDQELVRGARLLFGSTKHDIARSADEDYWAFNKRVREEGQKLFPGEIVLYLGSAHL